MWPDQRLLQLLGIELPIIQAPMAGVVFAPMVAAVSAAGGLGSLPCATLSRERARSEIEQIRRQTSKPFNLNFFCHPSPRIDAAADRAWRERLHAYYVELGLDQATALPGAASGRAPFDQAMCDLVQEIAPKVVSFHFGLPEEPLLSAVRATGAKIVGCATTVAEARWLEDRGCDAIIAQGFEAGGHRGAFLSVDMATQVGTMALVPQVVDAVRVPVVAAGGIADARGIVAALALGAAGVQIGTAYLFCPEASVPAPHLRALKAAHDHNTALTNVFTGRPARGVVNRLMREVGPLSDLAPEFPRAALAIAPLRAASESAGSSEFIPLWSGQAARLGRELPAAELTQLLARETLQRLQH
jgi:nitronate monooxygenase